MPDLELWKIAASLGVPGFALLMLYLLFRGFRWEFPRVPRGWVGPLVVLFMLIVCILTLFALDRFAPDGRGSELYRLRVTVLGQSGRPLPETEVSTSVGGEVKSTGPAGHWQIDIPRGNVPADGRVVVYASHQSGFLAGKAELQLKEDLNPAVSVEVAKDRSAHVLGEVQDATTLTPLIGASVSVAGYGHEAVSTRTDGSFDLPAHAATGEPVRLRAQKDGYLPTEQEHLAGDHPARLLLKRSTK
jgi:hypothetical protein